MIPRATHIPLPIASDEIKKKNMSDATRTLHVALSCDAFLDEDMELCIYGKKIIVPCVRTTASTADTAL